MGASMTVPCHSSNRWEAQWTQPHVSLRTIDGGKISWSTLPLLFSCIRLVGGFIGNIDKTLYWSAVCAASGGVGCHCMCTASILKELISLPKTTWEKRQRRTSNCQRNRRRHATQSEVRWATTGRVAAPSIAYDGVSRLYQGGDH